MYKEWLRKTIQKVVALVIILDVQPFLKVPFKLNCNEFYISGVQVHTEGAICEFFMTRFSSNTDNDRAIWNDFKSHGK